MLEITALSAQGNGGPLVCDVELTVRRGEAVAVMGRSPAGKSTLLKAIVGIIPVTAGTISFAKRDITRLRPFERTALGIGYVPQRWKLFPSLSVEEHLMVAARPGPFTAMQIYRTFPALAARRASRVARLTADEQRLLALGCVLSLNPRLLLIDDILDNVDQVIKHDVLQLLVRLKDGGAGLIVVSNAFEDLRYIATRFVVMDVAGRIAYDAPQTRVLLRPEEVERHLNV